MNNDTRQADIISRNHTKESEYKDNDSLVINLLLGCIGGGVFIAIVMLIVAVKGMV